MFVEHAAALVWLALAILAGGVVSGILAGLFGIGGGGVIVPVLYEVFRVLEVPESVRMQLCVGTSLAIIIPTAFRSYQAHRARGAVLTDVVRAWTIPAVIGVGVGAVIAGFAPGWVFKLTFALIATLIAIVCCSAATIGASPTICRPDPQAGSTASSSAWARR